jgi:hypothetical protein
VRSRLLLAAAVLGAFLSPGAALADGPGYGGTADALTVQWQKSSGLAVFAVGFRAGSAVKLRVGSSADTTVAADVSGALRILVLAGDTTATNTATTNAASGAASPSASASASASALAEDATVLRLDATSVDRFSTGTSIVAAGQTAGGTARRLIGSVPPEPTGRGLQDAVPWAGALAALATAAFWLRRRLPTLSLTPSPTHRWHPLHRTPG